MASIRSLIPAISIWGFLAALTLSRSAKSISHGILPGNDDYMRIVQIRDWLGGQGWSDAIQSRLYPPDPLISHWTRLPDMLTGGVIKVLAPLTGMPMAETIALLVMPLGLFLAALILSVRIGQALLDAPAMAWACAMMTGFAYPVLYQFAPGRIDHHGLQIVLALWVALWIISSKQIAWKAAGAGALCGISLWVGIESAPYVAAACAAIGLIWVLRETNAGRRLALFAGAFAGSTAFCLLITRPINQWGAACDAISSVYLVMSLAIAAAMGVSCLMSGRLNSPWKRLFVIGGLGITATAATILLYPNCLSGPYAALDPRLSEVWLANVREAKTLPQFFADHFVTALAMVIVPVFSIFGFIAAKRNTSWLKMNSTIRTLFVFVAITALAGIIQTRMFSFSAALGAPLAAFFLMAVVNKMDVVSDPVRKQAARSLIWLLLFPMTLPVIAAMILPVQAEDTPKTDAVSCLSPDALESLNDIGKGYAITQIDLGAPLLAHTDLSVSSAPYHRNEGGLMLAIDMFLGSAFEAQSAASKSAADYLIICLQNSETKRFLKMGEAELLKQIGDGNPPDWLIPIPLSPPSNLRAFRLANLP